MTKLKYFEIRIYHLNMWHNRFVKEKFSRIETLSVVKWSMYLQITNPDKTVVQYTAETKIYIHRWLFYEATSNTCSVIKVNLTSLSHVTLTDFGFPVQALCVSCLQRHLTYFSIYWLWANLMKIIPVNIQMTVQWNTSTVL